MIEDQDRSIRVVVFSWLGSRSRLSPYFPSAIRHNKGQWRHTSFHKWFVSLEQKCSCDEWKIWPSWALLNEKSVLQKVFVSKRICRCSVFILSYIIWPIWLRLVGKEFFSIKKIFYHLFQFLLCITIKGVKKTPTFFCFIQIRLQKNTNFQQVYWFRQCTKKISWNTYPENSN